MLALHIHFSYNKNMTDIQSQPEISWRKNIRIAILFWILNSLATVFIYAGFNVRIYPSVLAISLLWYLNYTLLGLVLYWLTHKIPYEKYSRLVFFFLHTFLALIFSAAATALAFLDLYFYRSVSMQNYLDEMYRQYFHICIIFYSAAVFFFYFLHYLRRSREQAVNAAHYKQLSQEAELKALKAQINPHFLFNALNSINSLVVKEPLKAREMIVSFSSTLRYVLETSGADIVSVREEIEFAKTYSAIEKIRFGDKFHIDYHVPQPLLNEPLPPVIIQPLVENAIKHGFTEKTGSGHVSVEVLLEKGNLVCRVSDTGAGLPGSVSKESATRNTGVGLKNIRERLTAMYGGDFSLTLENNQPCGCIATITLPRDEERLP
ncbi:MAG: hypothetical protein GY757_20270 [bacterium]|nr:hypothetical protein [bacterium]